MDKSSFEGRDWVFAPASNEPRTLLLVGCIGSGKSETGNSILKKNAFLSGFNYPDGGTRACKLHTTVLEDGQVLNVIDTPGLSECTHDNKFIAKEIVKCINNVAKDGIHAVLLVIPVCKSFTEEQAEAISSLWNFFGKKIADYVIVVFTGGEELEIIQWTLEDFLSRSRRHEEFKEIVRQYGDRLILFNNDTCDQRKKDEQVEELLSLVNLVLAKNGGKPYTTELSVELKIEAKKSRNQIKEVSDQNNRYHNELSMELKKVVRLQQKVVRKLQDLTEANLQEDLNSGHGVKYLLFITLSCLLLAILNFFNPLLHSKEKML